MKYKVKDYPDKDGFYGKYGGRFLSPEMDEDFRRINDFYQRIRNDAEFINELKYIRKHYQGRPTPITYAKNLSDKLGGAAIYLKREDLNHTGAHKLNHAMAYVLVAKKMLQPHLLRRTKRTISDVFIRLVLHLGQLQFLKWLGIFSLSLG